MGAHVDEQLDAGLVQGPRNFVAGNDEDAKQTVRGILDQFGWPTESILDLGDITGARAVEMYSRMSAL